ncbi:hypothetical protein Misp01_69720 [Microtetraspora sp. NBRC 13810]|uniref:hypothetical protein n=1 Tax=Microtetraspora sp. NBRC 13810 TaxID=3030990 RepID=UPI0024A25E2B|nr:hypothetical protein [Microtetraspora sp. NBRC 13810]GLW11844.1 hypothetical protein Misp01_69720 [Microtetraspora sp. NBRC 13810]
MRLLPRVLLTTSAAALTLTGCGELQEISGTVDKAQACLEATQVTTQIVGQLTSLRDNPEQLNQALDEAATKLEGAAAKAGDTTLQEALEGLANSYQNLDITDVNSAVDAAQKAATDTARYVSDITAACT